MQVPKPAKTYHAWFRPESNKKSPPSYQVFISASETYPSLWIATVVAMNVDSPVPGDDDGGRGFWNRGSQKAIRDLEGAVNEELKGLNPGKEIQFSQERWIDRR